jgi:hypothetical protein
VQERKEWRADLPVREEIGVGGAEVPCARGTVERAQGPLRGEVLDVDVRRSAHALIGVGDATRSVLARRHLRDA